MDDEITCDWFMTIIKRCTWLDEYTDPTDSVTELVVEDAIPKGFNYSARVLRLRAIVRHKSGKTRHLPVIMKSVPLNQNQSAFISEYGLFISETMIYDEGLSKMEQVLSDSGHNEELIWPKHFTVCKESSLLLQDLKELEYTMLKQREVTLEEGLLVVQALGKLHALSRILLSKNELDMKNFKVNHMVENQTIVQFVYIASLKAIIDAARITKQTQWYDQVDTIESRLDRLSPALKNLAKINYGVYDVLNHGDCWPNNIMYKYKTGTETPISIKLIDFQLCHHNSFTWDLVHFIYSSFLTESRELYLKHLIMAYRTTLSETYIKYGDASAEVPTEQDIIESMDKLKLFGYVIYLATVPRLVPNINSDLDLDLMSPDHAHKSKTVLYSIPEVFNNTKKDLENLYNVILNI